MGKRLRAAVIGIGNMGINHARIYQDLESVDLVAVCDNAPERLSGFTGLRKVNKYCYLGDMIEKEKLDIASVAVPTFLHYPVAKKMLRSGVNVLIEKPISSNEEEAEDLILTAKKEKLVLAVGHLLRFNPAIVTLKEEYLDQKKLGNIVNVMITRIGPYPERTDGTGILMDIGIHDVDTVSYLFNSEIKEIKSLVSKKSDKSAIMVMRLTNGLSVISELNWLTPVAKREIRITGTRAVAIVTTSPPNLVLQFSKQNILNFNFSGQDTLKNELSHFIKTVRKESVNRITGRDGLKALRIIKNMKKLNLG